MFIIIHGEDRVKSRQELQKLVDSARNAGTTDIVTLEGKDISLDVITQNIESSSLFGTNSRLTIIENLHRIKSKTELKDIITYLGTLKVDTISLILWENQELTKAQQNKFREAHVITNKISPTIFALTDAISPDVPAEKRIALCQAAYVDNAPEMILIMLARHLRLMISTFDSDAFWAPNMIWQKTKLTKIAKTITLEKLIALHHELALIDTQSKTGMLAGSLESKLTVWMGTL